MHCCAKVWNCWSSSGVVCMKPLHDDQNGTKVRAQVGPQAAGKPVELPAQLPSAQQLAVTALLRCATFAAVHEPPAGGPPPSTL